MDQHARRSRIDAFVKLQRTIAVQRDKILTSIEHGLYNALRIGQHQDPPPHPDSVRLHLTRIPHRPLPCSASAATDPPSSPAGNHPHIQTIRSARAMALWI